MGYVPDIVYYHHPCTDGLTSAAVVKEYYQDEYPIAFEPFNYGKATNIQDFIEACRDKHVLLVDCSFKKADIDKVAQSAESILVIDHHHTAYEQLKDYDVGSYLPVTKLEEVTAENKISLIYGGGDHSGASLTYVVFNPDTTIPRFIDYVRDIDLGRVSLPQAAEFRSWSRSIPFDVEEMRRTLEQYSDEKSFGDIFRAGEAINKYTQTRIDVIRQETRFLRLPMLEQPEILYAITDYAFASDVANLLRNETHPIGMAFYFTSDGLGASIRSDKGVDCSEIATMFGGGGHKQAAGFNIKFADLPDFLLALQEMDDRNTLLGNWLDDE